MMPSWASVTRADTEVDELKGVKGTKGYESVVDAFSQACQLLDFDDINSDFLAFLPACSGRVLDVGAGVGQNSAALARKGFEVVAVEPLQPFLDIAKRSYQSLEINWIDDSLPKLCKIEESWGLYDFILLDGVWHHLDIHERREAIERLSGLLGKGGVCAISLRNGPAGAGTHIFPTSSKELVNMAANVGLHAIFTVENQPSKMKGKEQVFWSRVALKKC